MQRVLSARRWFVADDAILTCLERSTSGRVYLIRLARSLATSRRGLKTIQAIQS